MGRGSTSLWHKQHNKLAKSLKWDVNVNGGSYHECQCHDVHLLKYCSSMTCNEFAFNF
jgi:hypothetical protein